MLKGLLVILVWGSLVSSAFAQKAQQILVVSEGGIGASAAALANAIKKEYPGVVSLNTSIPSDLTPFEAVMLVKPNLHPDASWLNSATQDRLIDYVKSGGRFYAEGAKFRNTDSGSEPAPNQFWDTIGDASDFLDATTFDLDFVKGMSGEFTSGMEFTEKSTIPVGTSFFLFGMAPILQGVSGPSGTTLKIAWRSPNPELKVILHWPVGSAHYDAFISSVVCTYFGLCTLGVDPERSEDLLLSYDPHRSELKLPHAGQIVIVDVLGRNVLQEYIASEKFELPQLSAGTYLVRWYNGSDEANTKIVVQ